ncbi:helix-turn-helix domain-containing protein [Sporichthya polymorpha]|uniref:helix-turn-helix domain-containing protein n=1 Tax=Sporichthya polymorpha TaxID=35751 RepID=UPI00037DC5CA|nr:helix-turn-helix domain-containing protein [Sporichthya polymorpha]
MSKARDRNSGSELEPDPLLTKQEIAELYGTTDRFVEKLIASGELPAYKLGGKLVRIRRSDALALLRPIPTVRDAL